MSVSSLPRFVRQPGTPAPERFAMVEAGGRDFELKLEAGLPLLEAVQRGFARQGFESGVCRLEGVTLARLSYVIPGLSKTPEHAAFYSDVYRPPGPVIIQGGALTFGLRDAKPFFHAHGLWQEADGKQMGGHILPEQTFLAKPCTVAAMGLTGALFEAAEDHETGFKIFTPRAAAPAKASGPFRKVFVLRLRPNTDFCATLEKLCADKAVIEARILGGVGSTIGARFDDGSEAPNFATEIFVCEGSITREVDGRHVARVDIGLIDYKARIFAGRYLRGDNPVLITFELVVATDQPWPG